MAAEYEGTVEQVHRAFADERYWRARLAESGVDEATLDAMRRTEAGGIAVVTTQTLRADRLPAVVTQLHAGDLTFVREEYADHGRPYGGRIGGELGHQRRQPSRRSLQGTQEPPADF